MRMSPALLEEQSSFLFQKQSSLLSLWQNLADNFYPERADFTVVRNQGQELADLLIDSYPVLARRDMGNSLASMLRDGTWFWLDIDNKPDHDGQMWLDKAGADLRRMMYFRDAGFVRATKEGDHDYVTFGQCVISVELNRLANGLLYRCWHLRDCAWTEDDSGQVETLHRRWNPTARQLHTFLGEGCHPNLVRKLQKEPFAEVPCKHIVMPAEVFADPDYEKFKYVSVHLDCENKHIMRVDGINASPYVVPRFQTIAGSQYAYSPATVIALPDARLIQAMTHTLLEAGERYARPPMVATSRVIRSDVDLSADGITWVDDEYDERMGAALRPIAQDRGGFPIGLELREDIKRTISSAFHLNKLSLPQMDHAMTATEVVERMKQFRRENLPLFAPIESEYNGQLCEKSFDIAMQAGLLGSEMDIPESLRGRDIVYRFKSPLSSSEEEERLAQYRKVREILGDALQLDPAAVGNVNLDTVLRDAIKDVGAPASWLMPLEHVMQQRMAQAMAQANEAAAQAE